MIPQEDGNQERKVSEPSQQCIAVSDTNQWAEIKEDEWDMEVASAFFGGMEGNRHEVMGTRPHWSNLDKPLDCA